MIGPYEGGALARIFFLVTTAVFLLIGVLVLWKDPEAKPVMAAVPAEIEELTVVMAPKVEVAPVKVPASVKKVPIIKETPVVNAPEPMRSVELAEGLPEGDYLDRLFVPSGQQFPFVETIQYKSKVPWLKGRSAWVADYATHYKTPRYFISRSLHGKGQYEKGDVNNGAKFNILDPDRDLEFYLVVDTSKCKCWLYAWDKGAGKRYFLKDYMVGLGRPDETRASGMLTPLGIFTLGKRIAVFEPKMMGNYEGKKTEMVRVFGTRWIPFEREVGETTAAARGFGIHGVPYIEDPKTGKLIADNSGIGKYVSDGCIRFTTPDIEEIYAIITTKLATIELVRDFQQAHLPGNEA